MNISESNGDLFAVNPNLKGKVIKGLKFVERKCIDLDDILVDSQNNKARYSNVDPGNVENLRYSYLDGIRYNEPLPILEKLKVSKKYDDGNMKFYELLDGFNRITALKSLGVTKYWFDIVEFDPTQCDVYLARTTLSLLSNAHPPRAPSSEADIITAVSNLVSNGHLENDVSIITDYLKKFWKQKGASKLANLVAARTGAKASNIYIWSSPMIKNDTYVLGISTHGNVDHTNGMHGWTCLESYEKDTIMNVVGKYYETGRKSYIVGHTKLPESTRDLQERRNRMKETIEFKLEQMVKFCEYYHANGKFPVEFLGFLPQSEDEDRTKIVK